MPDDNNMFANLESLVKLVRGSANSQSFAMINSVMAGTIGMSMHNAVATQHNAQILNSASTTSTCARILSVSSARREDTPPQNKVPPADTSPPGNTKQIGDTTGINENDVQ
jgi:hypothetical protein